MNAATIEAACEKNDEKVGEEEEFDIILNFLSTYSTITNKTKKFIWKCQMFKRGVIIFTIFLIGTSR